MKQSELKQLIREEISNILREEINYKPGGFTSDTEKPWKNLPPGRYEITYKPLTGDNKTYTLDFPKGKTFETYEEARKFYFENQPSFSNLKDRMGSLVKVSKIS
jgi:hypothetical protein